jgi:transposase InsO family protein
MSNHLRLEVLRRPLDSAQYTSYDFSRACPAGVERSMGSVGDCYDCDDPPVLLRSA